MKRAHLRPQAEADLLEAARHYAKEGSVELAERMFDAAVASLGAIERMPGIGSPRLGLQCEIPGLRSWRVTDFPMQWLYFEAEDHLDIVRLLGDRQDIIDILTAGDCPTRLRETPQRPSTMGSGRSVSQRAPPARSCCVRVGRPSRGETLVLNGGSTRNATSRPRTAGTRANS